MGVFSGAAERFITDNHPGGTDTLTSAVIANASGSVNDDVDVPLAQLMVGFLPTIFILCLLGFLFTRSKKATQDGRRLVQENTDAVKQNSELLQETIKLQREILKELRKRN